MNRWIPITEKEPKPYEEVLIKVPGQDKPRTGYIPCLGLIGWHLTDCTDPMQNCYLPIAGTSWRND